MSSEGFQPYLPTEESALKRGEKIPLPTPEVNSAPEDALFPTYTIRDIKYIALPLQTFWENFSEFPKLKEDDMFLVGNKNLELDVYDGNELTIEYENRWDAISSDYAVMLLPYESVKDTLEGLASS
jgi:hypothetical protein